ncbi:competence type IV pilus minor pilin ComGF [Cytobacillus sp. Hz8]|uniref:competence type IV pilus minor pilin ComGF n=1 Tax=Cytobacillus sp. Hz8 TaxID=3347168 RepID=UPI0035E22516
MLEMVFAFSIFCIIVSFLPICFRMMLNTHSNEQRIQRLEWEVFISQMKIEVQSADQISGDDQNLLLLKDGARITLEKYGANLRRRVNEEGHEIMLQNVQSVKYHYLKNGVTIIVTDTFQATHTATIYTIIDLEQAS